VDESRGFNKFELGVATSGVALQSVIANILIMILGSIDIVMGEVDR
jgi:NADH:ubiquinone oxidoreductase subunit D